jgi:hypothetical protein
MYTAISIKVVPEQSRKVEYEQERLLGISKKLMNFLTIPSSPSRSYSTFPLCSGTTLIERADIHLQMNTCMYNKKQNLQNGSSIEISDKEIREIEINSVRNNTKDLC